MASLATLGTIAAVAGAGAAGISAYATIQQGQQAKEQAEIAARQEEAAGTAEYAAAQRQAEERRMEGRLVMSRQQALAAASGAGAGDDAPTIVKILSDTAARTEYGVQSELYGGLTRRDDYNRSASARRTTGENTFFGSLLRAGGTLLGGVGNYAETKARFA